MKKVGSVAIPLLPQFAKFIAASKRGKRAKYAGRRLAPGTIQQYACVRKLLEEFESRQQITLRILLLKRQPLSLLKKEQVYWKRFFASFTSFLYKEKQCYDCYVCSVAKTLKAFFNYLAEEKLLPVGTFHKQFRVAQALRRLSWSPANYGS